MTVIAKEKQKSRSITNPPLNPRCVFFDTDEIVGAGRCFL